MTIQVVRFDDIKPQPWRNGGGVTRELLTWPDANNWLMRLSVADIERDGPFSAFPGIDRWFAVLTGHGVQLGMPGRAIQAGESPVHFDGATAPDCKLINGSTRDLNLMIRRDSASGWMKRAESGVQWQLLPNAQPEPYVGIGIRGVFTLESCELRCDGNGAIAVPAMSVAWTTDARASEPWFISNGDASHTAFAFQCTRLIDGENHNG